MARLARGDDYLLTPIDKWQIETLKDAGYLLEDIQGEISKKTGEQLKEIKAAMEDAGVSALEYDHEIYKAAGLSPMPLEQSPHLVRLMQRNYEATMGEWNNFTRTTANTAQQLFIQEVDRAYTLVSSGTVSYTQAVKETVDRVASEGVVVTYPSGRKDTIETATLRAVRTGISQATGAIQMARLEEMDWDIILTSAHVGARTADGKETPENHFWWQGRFFSRTGENKELPDFIKSTGYGTVTGICGANCRHSFGPGDGVHNPFENIDTEENKRVEQLNKRQRELERRIRKTKRERQALKTAIDNCQDKKLKDELKQEFNQKTNLLKKQKSAYEEFCSENKLKPLNDRLQIAKADKLQNKKGVADSAPHDTIEKTTEEKVLDVHTIGKIDKDIFRCVSEDIVTDEVIITDNQILHIMERHPNDYERFSSYFGDMVGKPDFIIEAAKPKTALILKEITDEREVFKLVLRLATTSDNPEYKNSIITFMKIDEKEWNRLLKNKNILYKKE